MIDIENKNIISLKLQAITKPLSARTKYFSLFELNNGDKEYLYCYIQKQNSTVSNYYLSFHKFQFYGFNVSQENNYKNIASTPLNDIYKVHPSLLLTCIEITKYNLIQCFYLNVNRYLTIGLFNENNLEFIDSEIIENTTRIHISTISENSQFYKNILLKDEVSIIAYRLDNTSYNIYLELKNIIYNNGKSKYEIVNYLNFQKIKLNNNSNNEIDLGADYYLNNLLKINDNKFIIVSTSKSYYELFLIIFDIHEDSDISLFIRYYKIPLKIYSFRLYNFLECQNYNGFITIIYATYITPKKRTVLQFLSIFSYINGTDSEIITLQKETILKPRDYINEDYIENNVFGVEFCGIKIIKLPNSNENGVFYISKEKNNTIHENDILNAEDEIIFIYDYDDLNIGDKAYTIEMAGN